MENIRIIYKGRRGTIREISACDWYGNENHYKSTGCKFLGAYNEELDPHRRWAAKLKVRQKGPIINEDPE
jgi:hypothetical protein